MPTYAFNVRATAPFVTDGSGEVPWLGEAYPISGNGCLYGNPAGNITGAARDRSNTVDRRLAGMINIGNGNGPGKIFKVVLAQSGACTFRLAAGDASNGQNQRIQLKASDGTLLLDVGGAGGTDTVAGSFMDATAVVRTAANWPGQNVGASITVPVDKIIEIFAGSSGVGNSSPAHFSFEFTGAPADTDPPSVPVPSQIAATSTTATVGWTPSTDNVGVSSYLVRNAGGSAVDIGNPAPNGQGLIVYTPPTPGAWPMTFQVAARDAAGNISAYSSIINLTNSARTISVTFPSGGPIPVPANGATLTGVVWKAIAGVISAPAVVTFTFAAAGVATAPAPVGYNLADHVGGVIHNYAFNGNPTAGTHGGLNFEADVT